ncbi:MAG: TerC family protein [Sandaracinaceae bacterium]|nr:TerC family protein [Sandaracinaceae bacterium]
MIFPESVGKPGYWAGFIAFVILMLALDLGVFHRKAHVVRFREAAIWSAIWIAISLLFGAFVWWEFGSEKGWEFLAGYVLEKSLSVDNIFVFILIFSSLGIPRIFQHRVLFYGILGALLLRAGMIIGGAALIERFHWVMYVFGAFLVYAGAKIFFEKEDEEVRPEDNKVMKFVNRFVPSTSTFQEERFFIVENGKRVATPLFTALVLVELSDVVFAVDSIPAIFAITTDPFIVFTSNICAILGLRSLFFLLAEAVDQFRYLPTGLAFVLIFVGLKMIAGSWDANWQLHPAISLSVILGFLAVAIVASIVKNRQEAKEASGDSSGGPPTER